MDPLRTKRITYKLNNPNPLFQVWLQTWYEEAKQKKSKLEPMLHEALESLSRYPVPLNSGAECAILKGFDHRLCLFLDQQLDKFRRDGLLQSSLPNTSTVLSHNVQQPMNAYPSPSRNIISHSRPKKEYIPTFRSGGYAILIALLEHSLINPNKPSLNKDEIILKAQKHCEESFTRPKPDTFYTSWNNMSKLVEKELVKKSKRKKQQKLEYSLTEEGTRIAQILLEQGRNRPTMNDIIFNDSVLCNQPNIGTMVCFNQETDNDVRADSNNSLTLQSQNNNCRTADLVSGVSETVKKLHQLGENNKRIDTNSCELERRPSKISNQEGSSNSAETITKPQLQNIPENLNLDNVFVLNSDSFEIILLIDKNEVTTGIHKKNDPTVAQFNKYPNLKHEYRSLKVGDFTWIARHKTDKHKELVLPYIIERKRMDDLGSSIKDGRFHEQKFRLRRCGIQNVIYMVENYGSNRHVGLPLTSLMQALANTRVQDGFKVHVTDSLTNSARFLAMMTRRLTIRYENRNLKGTNTEPRDDELMSFEYFKINSAKNKSLTVTETFIKLLLQLKGMSVEKALAITNAYNTPRRLIQEYAKCDCKKGEMLLANLKYEGSRNVGPVISKTIYLLFSNKDLV